MVAQEKSEFLRDLQQFHDRVRFVRDAHSTAVEDLPVIARLDIMLERLEAIRKSEEELRSRAANLSSVEEMMWQLSNECQQVATLVHRFRCDGAIRMLHEFVIDIDRLRANLEGANAAFCDDIWRQSKLDFFPF